MAIVVATDPPAPLVDVDPAFAVVVMRCLEKEPASRYASVVELAAVLGPLGGPTAAGLVDLIGKLAVARPPTAPAAFVDTVNLSNAPTVATSLSVAVVATPVATSKKRPLAIVGGLAAAGAISMAVVLTWQRQSTAPVDPRAAKMAALHTKLEASLVADRCNDAAEASYDLQHLGEDLDVLKPLNERLGKCSQQLADASGDPTKPGAMRILLVEGDEMFDGVRIDGVPSFASFLLDYRMSPDEEAHARSLGAKVGCKHHDRDTVKKFADKLAAGPARDALAAYCAAEGFSL
jgi:hypothetical protein